MNEDEDYLCVRESITPWEMFWIVLIAVMVGHVLNDFFIYQYIKAVVEQWTTSLAGGLFG